MKTLRPSVMRTSEWYKREERDPNEWRKIRTDVIARDGNTCVYCGVHARSFLQVNHVGAEDHHDLDNLETTCKPCHQVLHMGINSSEGRLSVIDSAADQADIVRFTRHLVLASTPWEQIEQAVLQRFLTAGGKVYDLEVSVGFANDMLLAIPPDDYRGTLPEGLAVVFHEEGPWKDFPERVHRWGMTVRQSVEYVEHVRALGLTTAP